VVATPWSPDEGVPSHSRGTREVDAVDITVPGPRGDVGMRVYREPGAPPGPGLVWVHGGGWAAGDIDMPEADWLGRRLASSGIVVVSVDYRLAKDGVAYPLPHDDVHAATAWVLDNLSDAGVAPGRCSLGGASAGADLAVGVAMRLRDEGSTLPWTLVLAYPALHAALLPPSSALAATLSQLPPEERLTASGMDSMARGYAGVGALDDPYAFPGGHDPAGLPPVFVLLSEVDALRPSGEAFAADAVRAGVPSLVVCEAGSRHGHLNHAGSAPAEASVRRIAAWLASPRELLL